MLGTRCSLRILLLVIAFAPVAPGQVTLNAKFAGAKRRIHKVCMVPSEATLYKAGVKGGEGMIKESEEWAVRINKAVRNAFTAQGAEITGDYVPEQLKADEKLREAVLRVRQKYNAVWPQIRRKPGDVKKGRYSMGDEIALLPCSECADAVAFVQVRGTVLTTSGKFGLTAGGPLALILPRSDMWLSLVDAKTGEVITVSHLWSSTGNTFVTEPAKAFHSPLQRYLKAMHVGLPAGK